MMALDRTHVQDYARHHESGISMTGLFQRMVRLLPALALFALVLTDDPVLPWLSVLGVVPLALALLPGTLGGCAACHSGRSSGPLLPPAH